MHAWVPTAIARTPYACAEVRDGSVSGPHYGPLARALRVIKPAGLTWPAGVSAGTACNAHLHVALARLPADEIDEAVEAAEHVLAHPLQGKGTGEGPTKRLPLQQCSSGEVCTTPHLPVDLVAVLLQQLQCIVPAYNQDSRA